MKAPRHAPASPDRIEPPSDRREDTRWLVRSISLPVAECLSLPWRDFLALLRECWQHSTCLANWASHTLSREDVVRTPGMESLPPMVAVDLYALAFGRAKEGRSRQRYACADAECKRVFFPSACADGLTPVHLRGKKGESCPGVGKPVRNVTQRALPIIEPQYEGGDFWKGAKVAAATLLRKVDRKYRKERGKVVWRRERRTPEFTYPYPFPVSRQAWAPSLDDSGRPLVSLGLPNGRVTLRLRGGPEMAHKMRVFGEMVEGGMATMELSIGAENASASHRRQGSERLPGGGHRNGFRVMVRMAYRMEAPQATMDGTCLFKTGADPFITLTIPGAEDWKLFAPWARQRIAGHRAFLDRAAHDLKFEKRWPRSKRRRMLRRSKRRVGKQDNCLKSFLQETAAQVVGWCVRRHCGRLLYDDSDRSFVDEFPWFQLRQTIQDKCDEMGVVLDAAGPAPASGIAVEMAAPDDGAVS